MIDNDINNQNIGTTPTKTGFFEKLAQWILYFGGVCCLLCFAGWLYMNYTERDNGFMTFFGLVLWLIIRWFCRWIYSIIKLWVNQKKRNASLIKIQEANVDNNLTDPDPSTKQVWLSFDNLPKEMYEYYTEIKASWFRLFETTPYSKVSSRYVHSITRGNKNREVEATHALYIEHQFVDKDLYLDAYVQIKPDNRDNIRTNIMYFLVWPWIIARILFDDDLDVYEFAVETVQWYGIDSITFFVMLFFFSGYISYLIRSRIANHNAVRIESRDFEKWFDVNSNDPIVARQICDPIFIADLDSWLIQNNLKKYSEIYFDFRLNRLLYKFDYSIVDKSEELNQEYVKDCISMTSKMIEKISILRNIAVVYAGRIALDISRVKQ